MEYIIPFLYIIIKLKKIYFYNKMYNFNPVHFNPINFDIDLMNDDQNLMNDNIDIMNINNDLMYDDNDNTMYFDPVNFIFGKLLGKGMFGQVYEAERNNYKYAVKVVDKSEMDPEDILMTRLEIEFLSKLNYHENIVKYYGFYENNNKLYIYMEYLEGITLGRYINFTEYKSYSFEKKSAIVTKFMIGLTKAIKYIHSNGILHRDIKPSNIIITTRRNEIIPVIIDFGLSCFKKTDCDCCKDEDSIGTEIYMAPEVYYDKTAVDKSDYWSLGVVMYESLYGKLPFNFLKMKINKTKNIYYINNYSNLSLAINGCLIIDHKYRFDDVKILSILT